MAFVSRIPGSWNSTPTNGSGSGSGSVYNGPAASSTTTLDSSSGGNQQEGYFTPSGSYTNIRVQQHNQTAPSLSNRVSVTSASSMPSVSSYEHESMVHKYYPVFCQFTGIPGGSNLTDSKVSGGLNKARQKLLKLSKLHFLELSTDVYDELCRRMSSGNPDTPSALETRDDIHPKRNHARQKLALLSKSRFNDLATDILLEIERRFPEISRPSSQLSKSGTIDESFQSAMDSPTKVAQENYSTENGRYNNATPPKEQFQLASENLAAEVPLSQRNAKSMAFQSPTLPDLKFDDEDEESQPLENSVNDFQDSSLPTINFEENEEVPEPSVRYTPEISFPDENGDNPSSVAQALKTSKVIPTKATLVEETEEEDEGEDSEHEYDDKTNMSPVSSRIDDLDEPVESLAMERHDGFHHDNTLDDFAPETSRDIDYGTQDDLMLAGDNRSDSGSRLSRRLSQFDNNMLDAITEEESGFSDAQKSQRLAARENDSSIVTAASAGTFGAAMLASASSNNHGDNVEEVLKDKDDQIKTLVEEGSKMDDTINKLEAQLNESENVKSTLMEENSRLHLMVGDLEDQRKQAQDNSAELEKKLAAVESQKIKLEADVEEYGLHIQKHQEEKDAITAEKEMLIAEHDTALQRLSDDHENEKKALIGNRSEQEDVIAQITARHEAEKQELLSKHADELAESEKLAAAHEELQAKYSELQATHLSGAEVSQEHEVRLRELTEQHDTEKEELSMQIQRLQAEAKEMEGYVPLDVHEINLAKIADMQNQNLELESKIRDLEANQEQHSADLNAINDRYAESLNMQNQYSEDSASLSKELAVLRSRLAEYSGESTGDSSAQQKNISGNDSRNIVATGVSSAVGGALLGTAAAGSTVVSAAGSTLPLLSTSSDEDSELRQKYDSLKKDHVALEKELQHQQRITEQVQKEASEFLEEMRHLAENKDYLESTENLSKQVQELKLEVQEWKSRYSRTKSQLRNMRQSGIGATNSVFQTGVVPITKDSPYADSNGLVRDVSVVQFQLAMDEFLLSTRAGPAHELFHYLHNLIISTRAITQELSDQKQPLDEILRSKLAQGNSLVSTIANQLITITRNHTTSGGLSPMSVIDAAASDLSFAVIDLLKIAKVRLTDDKLNLSNNTESLKRNSVVHGQVPSFSEHRVPSVRSDNSVSEETTSEYRSAQNNVITDDHRAASRQINSGDHRVAPNHVNSGNHRASHSYSNSGDYRAPPNNASFGDYRTVQNTSANEFPTVQNNTSAGERRSIQNSSAAASALRESSSRGKISNQDQRASSRISSQSSIPKPIKPSFAANEPDEQPKYDNSSRYASYHRKSLSWDFDAEDPDNTVAELQAYLERKTVDAVDSIQNLLTGIREGTILEDLLPFMKNVIEVTNNMIEATGNSMKQTRNWLLKDKGLYILQNLEDCSVRLDSLYVDITHASPDVDTDRMIRQRLAGVSFDMAKCTKELVKTVEEVSLTSEIQHIDKQLQR